MDAVSGAERAVRQLHDFVGQLAYLAGGAIVGSEHGQTRSQGYRQLHRYSGTDTDVQLTPDLTDVHGIQLTADGATGVATMTTTRGAISVGPIGGGEMSDAIPASTGAPGFAQLDMAGNLFYSAQVPGGFATFPSDGARGPGKLVASDLTVALPTPDGRFVVGSRLNGDLVRVSVDGSGAAVLLPGKPRPFPVAITPDGAGLLYVSTAGGLQQPWLLPLSGGEPRRLAEMSIGFPFMRVSPDGRLTIFPMPGGTQLCRFPSFDQCRTVNVRSGPFADGRTVVAVSPSDPRNIIAQPIDGGSPVPLTAFTDMTIEYFSLSPDGTRIAISRLKRESDVVLITGLK